MILHPTEVSVQMPDNTKTKSNIFPRRRCLLPPRTYMYRDSGSISLQPPRSLSASTRRRFKGNAKRTTAKKRIVHRSVHCFAWWATTKTSTFPMMKCRNLKFRRNISVCVSVCMRAKSFRAASPHERELTIHLHTPLPSSTTVNFIISSLSHNDRMRQRRRFLPAFLLSQSNRERNVFSDNSFILYLALALNGK